MTTLDQLEEGTETEEELENLDADGNPIVDGEGESTEEETPEEKEAREAAEKLAKENEGIHPDFHGLSANAKIKAQKRFDKITGEKYKAIERENAINAENTELKERLEAIEAKLSGGASAVTEEETIEKPVRGEDEDDDEWIERLTEYKTEKKAREILKAEKTKAEKSRLQKEQTEHSKNTVENFKVQSAAAMERHEDYLEITAGVPINLKSELGQEILESKEHGAEIMYILGKDPELFAEVKALSGKALIKAIGTLETAATKAQPKKSKEKKKVPPDPANVNTRGTNHTGAKKPLKDLTPDEYYARQCAGKT